MKTMTKANASILTALFLIAGAGAQFLDENSDQSPDMHSIEYDAATTTIETTRNLTLEGVANITVELFDDLPTDWSVDSFLSEDGQNWTQVQTAANDTTESDALEVNGTVFFRANVTFPADRAADTTVEVAWILRLDQDANQGGNGGTVQDSVGHVASLFFFDASVDSDADGLPDTWEEEHFGDLDQGPDDDPDNDGFTNEEEFEAGSDPNDDNSRPESTVFTGGGTVDVSDRDIVHLLLGIFIVLIVMVIVGAAVIVPSKEVTGAVITGAVGAAIVAAMAVILALDTWALPGDWQPWAYLGINWKETLVLIGIGVAAAVAAVIATLELPQRKEGPAVAIIATTMVVLWIAAWLVFWKWDVPGLV